MAKTVVTMGGFGHEGLSANTRALGYDLRHLALDRVKPKTWLRRAKVIDDLYTSGHLAATIVYLHTTLLLEASKDDYRQAFEAILAAACNSKTIVFVFQDNLDGIFSMRNWETGEPMTVQQLEQQSIEDTPEVYTDEFFSRRERTLLAIRRLRDYENRRAEVNALISKIYESGAEVAPFFVRSDVTIRLQEFLTDLEQGVFLRLFVLNDRLQADQLKSLLSVLERYLRQVEGQKFSIDSRKSEKGTVYVFRSDVVMNNLQNLNEAFFRFDTFMTMCGDDPAQAQVILASKGLNERDAAFLVEKYSIDYKRLMLDTRHEFERKSLLLRQRREADVVDQGGHPVISWSPQGLSSLISAVATGGNIAINVGSISVINAQEVQLRRWFGGVAMPFRSRSTQGSNYGGAS